MAKLVVWFYYYFKTSKTQTNLMFERNIKCPTDKEISLRASSELHNMSYCPMSSNPWAKRDAWRYEGQFSRINRFKSAFPGLGIATVAFSAYLVYDKLIKKPEAGHH
ncbi:hypothetical protein CXQ85_004461 [Candidozyma haemuli]|uniref:NADH-ubiquinone oxidoreductase B12 subunit n=1 Tax=Candidozyma haemuli TaxID=45357 RepID=A0A2V1AT17_9ASCO|nr:hypothetical protein CXQ85_004461 [[Candida] haemuloni]PVH20945.1 hypothetical protein CXQ85_004461 [[Candida] haemuloni]